MHQLAISEGYFEIASSALVLDVRHFQLSREFLWKRIYKGVVEALISSATTILHTYLQFGSHDNESEWERKSETTLYSIMWISSKLFDFKFKDLTLLAIFYSLRKGENAGNNILPKVMFRVWLIIFKYALILYKYR